MPTQLPEVAAGTPYSEPLVSGLAALASLSRLSTLSITGSERLTDDSLAAVAKSTAIRDLSIISCNHITAEGVARSIMRMVQATCEAVAPHGSPSLHVRLPALAYPRSRTRRIVHLTLTLSRSSSRWPCHRAGSRTAPCTPSASCRG